MRDYSELQRRAEALVGLDDIPLAPDLILELIAENKRLTEELNCPFRLARHSKRLIERLREENEALRKDSDRYQWLRDKSDAVHQFYLSVPLWFTGVRFRAQDVDNAIDAMSKGEQP